MAKKEKPLKKIKYFDYSLVFIIIFLLAFGLIMIYSSSAYSAQLQFGNHTRYFRSQVRASILGVIAMLLVSRFPTQFWIKFSIPLYLIATALCFLVNFMGESYNNQRRWFRIGGFNFQPSEIGKIAIIILIAAIVSNAPKSLDKIKNIFKLLGVVVVLVACVAVNNLSTAIIMMGIAIAMIFAASARTKEISLVTAGMVIIAALYLLIGSGYRNQRVMVWLDPESYEEGYQVLQGLYAIGSGGIFGKGLGQGIQKLGAVPEAENDMIFSIICEELGLIGALCLVLMYIILLWRIWRISRMTSSLASKLICIGVMAHIGIQAVLNIAVATNSMPNTGISLPFVSYGGTAVLITLGEMGLVLAASREVEFDV